MDDAPPWGGPGFGSQEIPKPLGVRDDALNLFGRCPFEQFWGSAGHGGVLGVLAIGLKRRILRRVPKSAKTSEGDRVFFSGDTPPQGRRGSRTGVYGSGHIYRYIYIYIDIYIYQNTSNI